MEANIKNLIQALQIIVKYGDFTYPTHCEHDKLQIKCNVSKVSEEDLKCLNELGFYVDTEDPGVECLKSYKYGSA